MDRQASRTAQCCVRGIVWAIIGDNDRTIEDLDQAIRLDAGHASTSAGPLEAAYHARGRRRFTECDSASAIADFGQAIRVDPHDLRAFFARGRAFATIADYDRAIADLDRTLQISSGLEGVHYHRGLVLQDQKRYEPAIADYSEAIQRSPGSAKAYAARGDAWRAKGDVRHAIRDYDRAIQLEHGAVQHHIHRGLALFDTKSCDKAIADFTLASQLQPRNEFSFTAVAALACARASSTKPWVQEHRDPESNSYTLSIGELKRLQPRKPPDAAH